MSSAEPKRLYVCVLYCSSRTISPVLYGQNVSCIGAVGQLVLFYMDKVCLVLEQYDISLVLYGQNVSCIGTL